VNNCCLTPKSAIFKVILVTKDSPAIKDFQVTKVQQAVTALLVTKDCPAIKDFQVTKDQQEIKVLFISC
jgi:hypothetical protein